MSEKSILGWHFTSNKLRDGRPIPPVGEWLIHDGNILPCESGLHASEHPYDALRYALGNVLHRVELAGELIANGNPIDKWVGRKRRIIASIDSTDLLWRFARSQALSVIHLWQAPEVVKEYLETGKEDLRAAARAAAWDAARAAAWAAAWDAAWDAARAAAWAAAWDAARAAAWAAAWAAAGDAARGEFLSLVLTEFNMKGDE